VAGCEHVLHVASPIPAAAPKIEDELIRPARDDARRVLKAARDAKVRRVVFTSSCGAIYYGHPPQTAPFDERWRAGIVSRERDGSLAIAATADSLVRFGIVPGKAR